MLKYKHCSTIISVNLALSYRKNVNQSSTYQYAGYSAVAENVVDGITDQRISQGSCSHTDADNPAWWRIQFQDRVYIQRIVIYYMNDSMYLCLTLHLITIPLHYFIRTHVYYCCQIWGNSSSKKDINRRVHCIWLYYICCIVSKYILSYRYY